MAAEPATRQIEPAGMRAFSVIWLGQVVSYLGSGMTRFALTVWAYQETGSAEALALVGFFSFVPILIMTPLAGALVDRWNRKVVLILSDSAAAIATAAIALLYYGGMLQVWHIMVAAAFAGIFESFQWPAFSASVVNIVKKEDLGRANGMLSLADSLSRIVAPVLAGVLLVQTGLGGILFIDIATCAVAVVAVLMVAVPQPAREVAKAASIRNLWNESVYGFRYIWHRSSLLALALIFFFGNFLGDLAWILIPPYILTLNANGSGALALVESAVGIGGVVGGLLMSTWGGARPRMKSILPGFIGSGLLGTMLMGLGNSLPVWMVAGFITMFFIPIVGGSSQAIWQVKIAPDIQGRVFAARRVTAQVSAPLGMILGGVLADRVFEPMMRNPESLGAQLFAPLVGVGPGSGIALILVIAGVLMACVGVVGYFVRILRDVEKIMPDYEEMRATPIESGGLTTVAPEALAT